jgi:hypothetical protein
VVKFYTACAEVNSISNVVPDTSSPVSAPMRGTANVPSQQRVRSSRLSTDPTGLELGEMALEEANLMFAVDARWVGGGVHDAEMVVDLSRSDGSGRLGNQLGSTHVLPVPVGGAVEGELETGCASTIGWVLVAGIESEVGSDGAASVDIVLVFTNLVAPRPFVQIRNRLIVESSIPQDCASRRPNEGCQSHRETHIVE